MVSGWQMSAEAVPLIDIAAIFGLLFICHPELTGRMSKAL